MVGELTLAMMSWGDLKIVAPITMPTMMLTASHRLRCARGSSEVLAVPAVVCPSEPEGAAPCGDAVRAVVIRRSSAGMRKQAFPFYSTRRPIASKYDTEIDGRLDFSRSVFFSFDRGSIPCVL